ncbi:MAG: hypothetical protein ABFD97_04310 [Syntrophobacter sp.]
MNRESGLVHGIFILAATALLAGCVTANSKSMNILESGFAKTKTVVRGDDYVTIKSVGVFQEDDNLIISGMVERLKSRPRSYDAHIDYAVLAEHGTVLKYGSTRFLPFAAKRWTRPFSASLPIKAGKGTVVRLAYHPSPGPSTKEFKCPWNAALPSPAQQS